MCPLNSETAWCQCFYFFCVSWSLSSFKLVRWFVSNRNGSLCDNWALRIQPTETATKKLAKFEIHVTQIAKSPTARCQQYQINDRNCCGFARQFKNTNEKCRVKTYTCDKMKSNRLKKQTNRKLKWNGQSNVHEPKSNDMTWIGLIWPFWVISRAHVAGETFYFHSGWKVKSRNTHSHKCNLIWFESVHRMQYANLTRWRRRRQRREREKYEPNDSISRCFR